MNSHRAGDGLRGEDLTGWADYRLYEARHKGGSRVIGPETGGEVPS